MAKSAHDFSEVDDPGGYNFHRHFEKVRVGDLAVFKQDDQYLLVRVLDVAGGPDWGTEHTEVSIVWEPRLRPV